MKKNNVQMRAFKFLAAAFMLVLMVVPQLSHAQLGAGIDGATGEVKGIFSNVSTLILAIGGIVGLVGGIRVYIKWNNGDQDVQKELIGWVGACVFLLISGVVVKTMFNM